jgi:hypothetical protein
MRLGLVRAVTGHIEKEAAEQDLYGGSEGAAEDEQCTQKESRAAAEMVLQMTSRGQPRRGCIGHEVARSSNKLRALRQTSRRSRPPSPRFSSRVPPLSVDPARIREHPRKWE